MSAPRSYVVRGSGPASAAPEGSVPIDLYGVTGGAAGAVDSVNGKTGTVVLSASDIGALPSGTNIPSTPADIGAATAAQGAKADTAVQPAALSGKLNGLNGLSGVWVGTRAEHDAIATKDPAVLYAVLKEAP